MTPPDPTHEAADNVLQNVNIASALTTMAREQPDKAAIYLPVGRGPVATRRYRTLSYAELDALSNRVASGLLAQGWQAGDRAALMVPPSPELFGLVFGLYKAGIVPVMIDPGIGMRRLGRCLAEAQPVGFIGISPAHAVRLVLGWGKPSVKRLITVGRRWFWGGMTFDQVAAAGSEDAEIAATDADDVAAILFTSGATGPPKGVVYRHRHFAAQVEMIRGMYAIQPGEIDLPTFPLFGLFDPALGMTTVIPKMDFTRPAKVDPREIIDAANRFSATNMFGSPALLDTVSRYAELHGQNISTMCRVISAGAPVRGDILRRTLAMIGEGGKIHTPYGATENLPVASIDAAEILGDTASDTARGKGVCVGRPHPRNDVRIIAIDDGPLPVWRDDLDVADGEMGEITVLGPTTTDTYYGRDRAMALAKMDHDGGLRHRMGDVGWRDGKGRIWFCGRKAHRVQTANGTLFTVQVEGVFNAHPKVRRCALVGIGHSGAQVPVVVLEPEPGLSKPVRSAIVSELRAMGEGVDVSRGVEHFVWREQLPVDIRHNAKINRPELARWVTDNNLVPKNVVAALTSAVALWGGPR